MEPIKMPILVDEPMQVFLWGIDELVPIMAMLAIGMMVDRLLILLLIGMAAAHIYRRYRGVKPEGYLMHKLYWMGIVFGKGRIKNGLEREYMP